MSNVPVKGVRNDPFDESRIFYPASSVHRTKYYYIRIHTHITHGVIHKCYMYTLASYTYRVSGNRNHTHKMVAAYGSGITESSPYHGLIFYFVIFYIPTTYKYFELKEQTFHTPISALFLDQEQPFLEVTMTIVTAVGKRTNK